MKNVGFEGDRLLNGKSELTAVAYARYYRHYCINDVCSPLSEESARLFITVEENKTACSLIAWYFTKKRPDSLRTRPHLYLNI